MMGLKEFLTIKMVCFRHYPQYSLRSVGATIRRPAFHSDVINGLLLNKLIIPGNCKFSEMFNYRLTIIPSIMRASSIAYDFF